MKAVMHGGNFDDGEVYFVCDGARLGSFVFDQLNQHHDSFDMDLLYKLTESHEKAYQLGQASVKRQMLAAIRAIPAPNEDG